MVSCPHGIRVPPICRRSAIGASTASTASTGAVEARVMPSGNCQQAVIAVLVALVTLRFARHAVSRLPALCGQHARTHAWRLATTTAGLARLRISTGCLRRLSA